MFFGKKGPHFAVLLGCIFYGMTGIFLARIHDLSNSTLIFFRLLFGFLLIGSFAFLTKRGAELNPGKSKVPLLIYGILVAANMFFYFICVSEACVSIAILLEYTAPIYVMLASPFVLGEKIGKENLFALIIAITGVFFVVNPDGFGGVGHSGNYVRGVVSGLVAGIILAAIIMYVRLLKRKYSEFAIVFWGAGISCLLMAPFAFREPVSIILNNLPVLAAFGFISVGLGGILTTIGFANLESQTGSLLALIEPVSGVFIDLAVLGIALSSQTLLGCFLVLTAAAIVSLKQTPETPSAVQETKGEGLDSFGGFSR